MLHSQFYYIYYQNYYSQLYCSPFSTNYVLLATNSFWAQPFYTYLDYSFFQNSSIQYSYYLRSSYLTTYSSIYLFYLAQLDYYFFYFFDFLCSLLLSSSSFCLVKLCSIFSLFDRVCFEIFSLEGDVFGSCFYLNVSCRRGVSIFFNLFLSRFFSTFQILEINPSSLTLNSSFFSERPLNQSLLSSGLMDFSQKLQKSSSSSSFMMQTFLLFQSQCMRSNMPQICPPQPYSILKASSLSIFIILQSSSYRSIKSHRIYKPRLFNQTLTIILLPFIFLVRYILTPISLWYFSLEGSRMFHLDLRLVRLKSRLVIILDMLWA